MHERMCHKILVMGLPGSGKTTLVQELAPLLNAVVFNNDEVRTNINRDLGFSMEDRIEQARRMGWLCDRVVKSGGTAIADLVCPTLQTRMSFGEDAFIVFVDRIKTSRFDDTNRMFSPPTHYDVRVGEHGAPRYWAEQIFAKLRPTFDPKKLTALVIGRFQPFHDGHRILIEESLRRVGQVCVGVRDTQGVGEKNPLTFYNIKNRIEAGLHTYAGRFIVIPLPNITHFFYGRDVGYAVERIDLDDAVQAISATEIRKAADFNGSAVMRT